MTPVSVPRTPGVSQAAARAVRRRVARSKPVLVFRVVAATIVVALLVWIGLLVVRPGLAAVVPPGAAGLLLVLVFVLAGIAEWRTSSRRHAVVSPGLDGRLCLRCGYDLSGLDESKTHCPECGDDATRDERIRGWTVWLEREDRSGD